MNTSIPITIPQVTAGTRKPALVPPAAKRIPMIAAKGMQLMMNTPAAFGCSVCMAVKSLPPSPDDSNRTSVEEVRGLRALGTGAL
jgi:hypothetical protein